MTSLWFSSALLPDGWARDVRITIANGVISSLEWNTAAVADDERHAVALPGLPNLHSHAFQRGMAGLAEVRGPSGDSFWTWREVMFRFLDRMDPDDMQAIAALAYAEMLESGFTRVGEFHYVHHDRDGTPYANRAELAERIAGAAHDTGIALTLLPVFYAHGGFGGAAPGHGQRRFLNTRDGFEALIAASAKAVTASLVIVPRIMSRIPLGWRQSAGRRRTRKWRDVSPSQVLRPNPSSVSAFSVTSTVAPVSARMAGQRPVMPRIVVTRNTALSPSAIATFW